jgi:hypothetical protein
MDITSFWGLLFCLVLPGLILIAAIVSIMSSNKVQVDAGQWSVLQDVYGGFSALGPGTHMVWPGTKVAPNGTIDILEQNKSVEKDSVNSADEVPLLTGYRYTVVRGRPYRKITKNPDYYEFDTIDPLDPRSVSAEMIIRLATAVKSGDYDDQAAAAMKAAIEATLGSILAKEVANITTVKGEDGLDGVLLPKDDTVPVQGGQVRVRSKATLYKAVAAEVLLRVNQILMPKGLCVTGVVITDCDYEEQAVRNARAASITSRLLVEAGKAAVVEDGTLKDLDPAVRIAIGTDDFQTVVDARGKVEGSKAYAKAIEEAAAALRGITTALAAGAARGLIDIHDNKIGGK